MLRVVSLFSGIGGADAGVEAAGRDLGIEVRVVAAYDKWDAAVERYNANRPADGRVARAVDVKALGPDDLPPHDLIVGGPPCQPFSLAGSKTGFDDPRNCVPDFIRLTRGGTTPFVMENVVGGLLRHYGVPSHEACLRADEYGDATTRSRWFYTNIAPIAERGHSGTLFSDGFDIRPEPCAPRTFADVRDAAADEAARERRGLPGADVEVAFRNGVDTGRILGPRDRFGSLVYCSNTNIDRRAVAALEAELSAARGRPVIVRHPSLREMARAHSIPDSFDWGAGLSQDALGLMVANSWPRGMARALMAGVLDASRRLEIARGLAFERDRRDGDGRFDAA